MPRITGGGSHTTRLKRLTSPEGIAGIGKALREAGERIQVEAQTSITTGALSGRAHVPSAPGTPPNNDSGVLANNIEVARDAENRLRVLVSSNAPYSLDQEFGNSKLPERPFMRPAAAKERPAATQLVKDAINHIARGGTVR